MGGNHFQFREALHNVKNLLRITAPDAWKGNIKTGVHHQDQSQLAYFLIGGIKVLVVQKEMLVVGMHFDALETFFPDPPDMFNCLVIFRMKGG